MAGKTQFMVQNADVDGQSEQFGQSDKSSSSTVLAQDEDSAQTLLAGVFGVVDGFLVSNLCSLIHL